MSPFAHWNISECQSGFMPVIPLSRPFSASLAPEKKNGILSNASTPLRSRKQKGYQVAQWNTVIQNNTKRDNNKKKLIVRNARMNKDFGRKIRLNRKTNSWSIQNVQDWGWSLDNKEESCFLLPSLTMFFPPLMSASWFMGWDFTQHSDSSLNNPERFMSGGRLSPRLPCLRRLCCDLALASERGHVEGADISLHFLCPNLVLVVCRVFWRWAPHGFWAKPFQVVGGCRWKGWG